MITYQHAARTMQKRDLYVLKELYSNSDVPIKIRKLMQQLQTSIVKMQPEAYLFECNMSKSDYKSMRLLLKCKGKSLKGKNIFPSYHVRCNNC